MGSLVDRADSLLLNVGRSPSGTHASATNWERPVGMASRRRLAGQGSVRGGKRWAKTPRIVGKTAPRSRCWLTPTVGHWGVVIEGANVPDCKMLQATIEAIVVERPEPTVKHRRHLCLDKGYDNPTGRKAAVDAKYTPHIRRIGEEKKPCDRSKGEKPRRWVVERTLAWLSKCRGILIRYDKKDINYLGLIQLACALCWYRRLYRMGRCNANIFPHEHRRVLG